ncbi:COX15/CtaA family protein [Methylocella sp.]|uniref:COX15/CtaA family protein n=1 Tax=Methylocella sp. TaxID=1978226 RepID=UPI0035AEC471
MTWTFDPPAPGVFAPPRRDTGCAVAAWLWSLAGLILLMVLLGGATRLTESGLSITQWKPLTGVVPPLSPEQWAAEFENYRRIPQYAQVFPDMDLSGFKVIFFFEWAHRLLGRLIGLYAALPMLFFWANGRLPGRLKPQLLGLIALGALQGFVGWWMVKSGLVERTEVAQERLAIHLTLASLTFAWTVWMAAGETFRRSGEGEPAPGARIFAFVLLALVFVQIFFGGLVAGLRAGRVYMTWPLIEGRFVPPLDELAAMSPPWRNVLDNMLTVQVEHRFTAYLLLALGLAQAVWLAIEEGAAPATRRALAFLALVAVQAGLGITTLLLAVPPWAGLAHQGFAMIVLAAATLNAQALAREG